MINQSANSNSENILPKLSLSLSGPPKPKLLDKYVSFESILLDKDIALEAMDYLDKISYFDQIDEDSESDSIISSFSSIFYKSCQSNGSCDQHLTDLLFNI